MKIRAIAHLKAPEGQFNNMNELERWIWARLEKAAVSSNNLDAFFKALDLEVLIMDGNLGVTKDEIDSLPELADSPSDVKITFVGTAGAGFGGPGT